MRMMKIAAAALLATVAFTGVGHAQDVSRDITIAIPVDPNTLDPCNVSTASVGVVARQNIVETLTELDTTDSSIHPRLATSWERIDDLTWRFKLREGVKFHDGTDFKADAVAYTLERLQNKALTCPDRARSSHFEFSTKIIDDHTIDIITSSPQVLIPAYLATIGMSVVGVDMNNQIRNPIGTGPYVFKSWDAQGIVIERFDGYWGEKPEVAKATYVVRSESTVRAAMVKLGEADIGVAIAPQDATEPDLDFGFLNAETTRIRLVMEPPLDDIRVRKALNLAFDHDALIGTVLSADVLPATHEVMPSVVGNDPNIKPWKYDPEEAKRLIEEARADGVPVDQEIRLIGRIGHYPNVEEVLQAITQMWTDVGLNIQLEMMESGQWLKVANMSWRDERPATMIATMHNNSTGDAAPTLGSRYHSSGNQSQTNDPELDRVIDEGNLASGDERRALFEQAHRIIAERIVAGVPMYHMVAYMRVGPRIILHPNSNHAGELALAGIKFKS